MNALLLMFQEDVLEVAFVTEVIASVHLRSGLAMINVHVCRGVQSVGYGWGLHLRGLHSGWMD